MRHVVRFVVVAVLLVLPLGAVPSGTVAQAPGDACVREFFEVARVDYGLSPQDVVTMINTDGDPTFQVDHVGHLRQRVANAEIGIIDAQGVYHICPNPN